MSIEKQIALLNNVPDELKNLNSWVVWRQENVAGSSKPTKIPYNPKTGKKASVTDPSHWCSYLDAVNCLANGGSYNGVGLVLTRNDPYFICDLDNAKGDASIIARQKEIAEKFDTYSEISPSGMGLHTVGKGSIPNGRRKDCIEIYSSERYITFTGNVYNNKPIKDCQTELTNLYNELSGKGYSDGRKCTMVDGVQIKSNEEWGNRFERNDASFDGIERYTDREILERMEQHCCNSSQITCSWMELYSGKWQGYYSSQSEADLAFANLISDETQNADQFRRIFYASGLGKRKKAYRADYLEGLRIKSLDRAIPLVNFEGYKKKLKRSCLRIGP